MERIAQMFAALGKVTGESYQIGEHATDILNEIFRKLITEDKTVYTFRRTIGAGQYVANDLIPFLVNVKEPRLIDMLIRALMHLTVPFECLFAIDAIQPTDAERNARAELSGLLIVCKDAFTDLRPIRAVVEYMKNLLDKGTKLTYEQCDTVNDCLLLLRNILHISDTSTSHDIAGFQYTGTISMQNHIIWNLFVMNFDKLLIYLMSCGQHDVWCFSMIQLVADMYTSQHPATLQQLLMAWIEDASSESSEDFESNTSPPKEHSGDSSPVITSDPTSDNSDNGGGNQNQVQKVKESIQCSASRRSNESTATLDVRKDSDTTSFERQKSASKFAARNSSTMELLMESNEKISKTQSFPGQQVADGVYTKRNESNSSASNDDQAAQEFHQKTQRHRAAKKSNKIMTEQERKERRRKKLIKRSKISLINMKGFVHHTPTDDDIANIMTEFTVDFLLKGYRFLVNDLYARLSSNKELRSQIDTSHFFWLITNFLQFATQLELDFEYVKSSLTMDLIKYFMHEAFTLCEFREMNDERHHKFTTLKPSIQRRMHLIVKAICEIIRTLNVYASAVHLNDDDIKYIRGEQLKISHSDELKQLFALLIGSFNVMRQSKQYLKDLIVANHVLFLLADFVDESFDENRHARMQVLLRPFANDEMMYTYGILLERFDDNGEFVNDCIFTMMYHVACNLDRMAALYQPIILKTYSKIHDSEFELCDDWADLIIYVLNQFLETSQKEAVRVLT